MEIIIVRHGESESNALSDKDEIFTGRWDCGLTKRGYEQAKALRGNPIFNDVDAFFVSNLKRAMETAKTITDRKLIVDPRLQERSMGDFEGKKITEVKSDPRYKKYFEETGLMSFRHSFTVKGPNAESYTDVCKRVRSFIDELSKSNYHKIVIVAHFVLFRCFLKEIKGLSEEETLSLSIPNCTPIIIEWNK